MNLALKSKIFLSRSSCRKLHAQPDSRVPHKQQQCRRSPGLMFASQIDDVSPELPSFQASAWQPLHVQKPDVIDLISVSPFNSKASC